MAKHHDQPLGESVRGSSAVGIIDRIEGETAVILFANSRVAYLPTSLLPEGAREGEQVSVKILHKIRKGT